MIDFKQDLEKWNDEMAHLYEPDKFITQTGWIVRKIEGLRIDCCRKVLKLSGKETVLDVGCGSGHLLRDLHAAKIVGVDLSEYLLEQARARLKGQENITLIKAHAEALPFPDQSFDRVACCEMLEHVQDISAVLKEIHRVTKPGSRVVISLPNEHLINISKKMVLFLGLKKWIAGNYSMSNNMMDEWHLSEITPDQLKIMISPFFDLMTSVAIPLPFLAYHTVFVLIRKTP